MARVDAAAARDGHRRARHRWAGGRGARAGPGAAGLPRGVEVTEDAREGRGPLQGLAAGLAAVGGRAEVTFVSSTDAPLLHPAFVRLVVGSLNGEHDVALPQAAGFPHPLAAAYRTALLPAVEELIAADRMRPAFLFEVCRVRRLEEAALLADPALAAFDPALDSVLNLNEPADYAAARARPAARGHRALLRGAAPRARGRAGTAGHPGGHARPAPRPRSASSSTSTSSRRSTATRSCATPRSPGERRHRRLPRRGRRRVARTAGRADTRAIHSSDGRCPRRLLRAGARR